MKSFLLLFTSFFLAGTLLAQTAPEAPAPSSTLPRLIESEPVREFPPDRLDLRELSVEQSELLIRIVNSRKCSCGCKLSSLATCLIKDKFCGTSPKIAAEAKKMVLSGQSEKAIHNALSLQFKKPAPHKPAPKEDPNKRYEVDPGNSPYKGTKGAPVTIVKFLDFQCGFCGRSAKTMDKLIKEFPGEVVLYIKNYPLPNHRQALAAAKATLAAHKQGKFWELHDAFFANPKILGQGKIDELAEKAGLKMKKFKKALKSDAIEAQIKEDAEWVKKLGVSSTPTLFVNGKKVKGAKPYEGMKQMVEAELGRGPGTDETAKKDAPAVKP